MNSEGLVGEKSVDIKVKDRKQIQWNLTGTGKIIFTSEGKSPLLIIFKGKGNKGV